MVKKVAEYKLMAMAFYFVTVTFIYIFCTTFMAIPDTGVKYADMSLPFLLGSIIGGVIGFYFGSSDGSDKSKELVKQAMSNTEKVVSLNKLPNGTSIQPALPLAKPPQPEPTHRPEPPGK